MYRMMEKRLYYVNNKAAFIPESDNLDLEGAIRSILIK